MARSTNIGSMHISVTGNSAKFRKATKQARGEIMRLRKSTERLNRHMRTLKGTMVGVTAAIGGVQLFQAVAGAGMRFEDLRSQLTKLTGSAEGAAQKFEMIRTVAAKTPISIDTMSRSLNLLMANSIEPTSKRMLQLADIAAMTANPNNTFMVLAESMQRAISGGAIFVEDLERLDNVGIAATRTLQELYGVQRHEIAELNKQSGFAEEGINRMLDSLAGQASGASPEACLVNLSTETVERVVRSSFASRRIAMVEFMQGLCPALITREVAMTLGDCRDCHLGCPRRDWVGTS